MNEIKAYSPYSVLMSVYYKEKPEFLLSALESMFTQSIAPNEVVIVEDGELTEELYSILNKYSEKYGDSFVRLKNETNLGLGLSLNKGLNVCKNELVARMDTDDISVNTRCEKQLQYLAGNPEVDIVGSNIAEFIDSIDIVVGIRKVPTTNENIVQYMKKRCPMNHMSVMFKKNAVTAAGGYQDWHYNEDYFLWIRMYLNGAIFGNINDTMVKVRVGADMYSRRGGFEYYKTERDLFKFMLKHKMIGVFAYSKAKIIRFVTYVLMSNRMRAWAYKKFAREK